MSRQLKTDSPSRAPRRRATPKEDFVHPVGPNRTERGIGFVQCQVTRTSQVYHSSLERVFVLLLGLHPRCRHLATQPETIVYHLNGVPHRYTPDCYVEIDGLRPFYAEIKPARDIEDPDNQPKWAAIRTAFNLRGADFKLFSDVYLFQEPRYDNVHRLQAYRSCIVDRDVASIIVTALKARGPLAIGELRELHGDSLLVRDTALMMIAQRDLVTDITQPLNDQSIVNLAPNHNYGAIT